MSDIENLTDLYINELQDLWSANDQMGRALKKIEKQATNPKLKEMLANSHTGLSKHTELLKSLIEKQDGKVSKEHCKGMEGLAAEALKHSIEEAPEKGPLLDCVIIGQYQRMTHYGITGFGTAAALAHALKQHDDEKQLKSAVKDMFKSDSLMSELAGEAVNAEAAEQ